MIFLSSGQCRLKVHAICKVPLAMWSHMLSLQGVKTWNLLGDHMKVIYEWISRNTVWGPVSQTSSYKGNFLLNLFLPGILETGSSGPLVKGSDWRQNEQKAVQPALDEVMRWCLKHLTQQGGCTPPLRREHLCLIVLGHCDGWKMSPPVFSPFPSCPVW